MGVVGDFLDMGCSISVPLVNGDLGGELVVRETIKRAGQVKFKAMNSSSQL